MRSEARTEGRDHSAAIQTTFTYDGRLNLITRSESMGPSPAPARVTSYEYDALNRLVKTTLPGGEVRRFVYDATGRRLATIRNAGTAQESKELHVYGPGWETLADTDAQMNPTRVYIMGGGMDSQVAMVVKQPNGTWTTYYYLRDHQGSVLALVDGTGNVVESYEYEPYGMPTVYTSTGATMPARESAFGNRHLYTGREWDPQLVMYHYRAKCTPPPHTPLGTLPFFSPNGSR